MEKRKIEYFIILFITILFLLTSLLSEGLIGSQIANELNNTKILKFFTSILMPLLLILFTTMTFRTIQKNPRSFTIAILGFPRSGKTVYLTVLFDLLQREQRNNFKFLPYGTDTIEKVANDYNTLTNKKWLEKTAMNTVFYYRAFATLNSFPSIIDFFKSRYKIEIADYAGEKFDELNPRSSMWLHRTDYFEYVVSADALFLAMDIQFILNEPVEKVIEYQNSFIVALNVLAEKKGLFENKKLEIPVSILFLKSDILKLQDVSESEILSKVERLIEVAKNRCSNFNHFFVSSVGETNYDKENYQHLPPTILKPNNVVSPIYWVLKRG